MLSETPAFPEKSKGDIALLNALASAHVLFGRLDQAISLLHLAVAINSEDLRTLELLAVVAIRLNQNALAQIAADRFVALSETESVSINIVRQRLLLASRTQTQSHAIGAPSGF